jgi:hypothetical protein
MNDKELIKRVKLYKAMGFIKNYYELAEELGITEKGLYNWLGGYYCLGYKNK